MICSIKLMLIYNTIFVQVHIGPYLVYLCFVNNYVFHKSKFDFIMSIKVFNAIDYDLFKTFLC